MAVMLVVVRESHFSFLVPFCKQLQGVALLCAMLCPEVLGKPQWRLVKAVAKAAVKANTATLFGCPSPTFCGLMH
ncbi:hypothetical protein ASU33_14940 [Solirubrum puertoriconensis]|uniref:Uncharacterized protein n=1 Tax=Solirubrum puertoriconensis TaxID=1751427 RepID=A0A9X0HKV1_SOLP1|nr:hypothetical protein ASU33_14940 [Solirubrum puertoriconensis]